MLAILSRPSCAFSMVEGLFCLLLFSYVPLGQATAFDCAHKCGVAQDSAYPHFVIGTVEAVADAAQTVSLFQGMRTAGRWKELPASSARFLEEVQAVSIRLPGGRSHTVLISRREADAAPLHMSDVVRYAPHRGINEKPPSDAEALAYWRQIGCIAVLCRAGDKTCANAYRPGVYRVADGASLSPDGKSTDPNAPKIDLTSMRPRAQVVPAGR